MKRILLVLVSIFSSYCVNAQFSDTVTHRIKFAATGNINVTGDDAVYLFNSDLGFSIKRKDVTFYSSNKWVYGTKNIGLTNNDVISTQMVNLYKTLPHFNYWGLVNYTSSYSLKINSQFQGGAGIAYNILDREHARINLSDGILYETSDLFIDDTVRDLYSTYRNSARVAFQFTIKEVIVFESSNFLQTSLNYGNDYIIRSTTSLSVKLRKWLSFTSALNYNKISRTEKENLLFTYGLTVDKYF